MKLKIATIACLILSTSAFAQSSGQGQERPQGEPPSFDQLDSNGDGYLSQDEVKGPLADDFSKIDSNGDGYISEDELPEPGQGRGGQGGGQGGGQRQ